VLAFLEFEQPKKLAHDHRHLSSNSAKIFAIPLYVYKKYRCASFLADTRTSRFTIAPSDKTNDHRPVIADHNFHFFFLVAPLAIFGRTRHDSREIPRADSFGEALEKTERSKFQMARCPFRATPGSSAEGVRDIIQADSVYG
jgi:hypothetical protein